MYEHRSRPLLSRSAFLKRMLKHSLGAMSLIIISLVIGIMGYHLLEHLSWLDALLNSSMILGGMGPVDTLKTTGGKIFASIYALFSGIVFLVVVGVVFAPVFHRFLHKFHLEFDIDEKKSRKSQEILVKNHTEKKENRK